MMQSSLFAAASRIHVELLESTWDFAYVHGIRSHYTESAGPPPGKKLAWRLHVHGEPVGHAGMGEPAFKLAARRRLGLMDARPLALTVSCTIFRVDPSRLGDVRTSELVAAWHARCGTDWRDRYGWEPVHYETMVGAEGVDRGGHGGALGACFRRSGYRPLGWTTGATARRPPGHTRGPRVWSDSGKPKLVLYRGPLVRVSR